MHPGETQVPLTPSNGAGNADGIGALRLTIFALALIVAGLCIVGKRTATWPIITWPMYSTRETPVPGPRADHVHMRIIDADGSSRRISSNDIFPMGRSGPARRLFVEAFEHPDPPRRALHGQYLADVVARSHWAQAPFTVEVWEYEWDVVPLELPPLEYDKPAQRRRVGAFKVAADGAITLIEP